MRLVLAIDPCQVFDYWRDLGLSAHILDDTYPVDTKWFEAAIEEGDVDKLFMIHASDFEALSKQTWKISDAATYFAENFTNRTYDLERGYHFDKLTRLLSWPGRYSTRMIMVTDEWDGPLTILDGNHRAILLADEASLVGATVFVGIHPRIRNFSWAQWTFHSRSKER